VVSFQEAADQALSHPRCVRTMGPAVRGEGAVVETPVVSLAEAMEEYEPAGTPVSKALDISALPSAKSRLGKGARAGLEAIDNAHGDGDLPALPVKRSGTTRRSGGYASSRARGTPKWIELSARGDTPGLSMAHEVGHFLDHQAIDKRGAYASETSPLLGGWRDATHASDAYRRLKALSGAGPLAQVDITRPDGSKESVEYRVDRRWVQYALQDRELFARSYAQYVANRGGVSLLQKELGAERASDLHQRYPSQWDDADFEPIAGALDALFRGLGWLRPKG